MKKIISIVLSISFFIIMAGCNVMDRSENNLIVYCSHSASFYGPIVKRFEEDTDIKVYVVHLGTGDLLERIEKEKDNVLGDVMWGGSLSALAPYKEYFEEYKSSNEDSIYPDYQNSDGKVTSFSVVPSVLIVNKDVTKDIKIEGYEDLLNPQLQGKIIGANPEKSSSAYEQLINQLYAMGNGNPDNGWQYVQSLNKNMKGNIVSSSSSVYKKVVSGDYGVGLTYEEPGLKCSKENKNIEVVYAKEGTIAKADGVAIIKGAKQVDNAKKFIDYVTGNKAQTLLANELNRRSVRKDVKGSDGMKSTDDIKLIYDDEEWVLNNKENIISKFNESK